MAARIMHIGMPARRWRIALAALMLLAGIAISCARSVDERGAVHIASFDAQVNPVSARYIDRVIDEAERADAKAVVIEIDTPGGLVSSMEDIVQRIETSRVPVVVWVMPGAKAASAGTFITMSGHVAAMGPGSRIGAAHPVSATGGDIEGDLGAKVENDSAAYARSIASLRGRNEEWAEAAVRDSVSATAEEAVELDVVDFIARDIDDLLTQTDGRTVTVAGGTLTLEGLAGAPRAANNMTFFERLLLIISDPNIAFLLLGIGGLGLLLELFAPGTFVPGTIGIISLILALFVLGTLPVNWAGVALILLAFALFAGEFLVAGFGVLGIGGIVALIAGGLLLTSSDQPEFQVNRWLIIGLAVACGSLIMLVIYAMLKTRRMPAAHGTLAMVGNSAIVRTPLAPEGFVFAEGARWKAIAADEDAPIHAGETVRITAVNGLTLYVQRMPAESLEVATATDRQRHPSSTPTDRLPPVVLDP